MFTKKEIENLKLMQKAAEKQAESFYNSYKYTENLEDLQRSQHYMTISNLIETLLYKDPKNWCIWNVCRTNPKKGFEEE